MNRQLKHTNTITILVIVISLQTVPLQSTMHELDECFILCKRHCLEGYITRYLGSTLECCSYLFCILSTLGNGLHSSYIPLQTVSLSSIKHLSKSCIMLCKGTVWRDITKLVPKALFGGV